MVLRKLQFAILGGVEERLTAPGDGTHQQQAGHRVLMVVQSSQRNDELSPEEEAQIQASAKNVAPEEREETIARLRHEQQLAKMNDCDGDRVSKHCKPVQNGHQNALETLHQMQSEVTNTLQEGMGDGKADPDVHGGKDKGEDAETSRQGQAPKGEREREPSNEEGPSPHQFLKRGHIDREQRAISV